MSSKGVAPAFMVIVLLAFAAIQNACTKGSGDAGLTTPTTATRQPTAPEVTCDAVCEKALRCVVERGGETVSAVRETVLGRQQYNEAFGACLDRCRGIVASERKCWLDTSCSRIVEPVLRGTCL